MIRARFTVEDEDFRPVNWPIKHPYWCSGYGENGAILIAYADNKKELLQNWPDAKNIESTIETEYSFTGRFPKPEWFNG